MSDVDLKKKIEPTPQQLDAANPAKSVWVSANAGSGKTHVLVERVIRLLLEGADPASILCITYTKAAAAEMSSRLFKRLSAWTALSDAELAEALTTMGANGRDSILLARARRLFTAALETPGGLKIQTIHAFCERLLHLFPVEAGIAPGFRVMDEREAREMQESATRHVLQLAEQGTEPELAASFAQLADRLGEDQFDELIRAFVDTLRKGSFQIIAREDYETALTTALGLSADATELTSIDRAIYLYHAERLKPHGSFRKIDVSAHLVAIAQSENCSTLLMELYLTTTLDLRKDFMAIKVRNQLPETEAFLKREQARVMTALQRANTRAVISASADALTLASAMLARISRMKSAKVGVTILPI